MSASKLQYCAKCQKRETCRELCRPVELHLAQTCETRAENNGDLPRDFVRQMLCDTEYPEPIKPPKQLIIEMYFIDRRKQSEICLLVGCSKVYVSQVIKRERAKVNKQK